MRGVSIIAVAALAIAVPEGRTAWAGPCQPSLFPSPIAGRDGYLERNGGQRCEGIYTSPVAGGSVEIVSLTRGQFDYDLAHTKTLSITLAVTPTEPSAVHVRAVGIPDHLYYQMDADMPVGRALVWPIEDVVLREQIDPKDIGVYAFRPGAGSAIVFLPVSILSADRAPASSAQPLTVILRVGAIVNPRWRFVSKSGAVDAFAPTSISDNRITLDLPAELHLPGHLELGWDDAVSGRSHTTVFSIGE